MLVVCGVEGKVVLVAGCRYCQVVQRGREEPLPARLDGSAHYAVDFVRTGGGVPYLFFLLK
jgi:hypothetical protein